MLEINLVGEAESRGDPSSVGRFSVTSISPLKLKLKF